MSPGWIALSDTRGSELHCDDAECGRYTPACAHAHDVRPEQSKPDPGLAAPQTYCVPTTDFAAEMAICAAEAFAGGAQPPPPPPPVPPPSPVGGAGAVTVTFSAASRAARCAAR